MEEVQVTAESLDVRLSGDLARYGSQVDVITKEDMDKAGVTDLNDAIKKLAPGVHVPSKMGPFSGARVNAQGGNKREVVWMVDGIRLSNRAFTTFRNNIAPQFIQRIEIIKGPQSIIYGSQGINAIINIITKNIQDPGEGTVEIGGSIGDRDWNSTSQHGDVSGKKGKHSFIVFGNSNSGQNRPFKEDQFETNVSTSAKKRRYDVQNVGVKYRYNRSEDENILFYSQFNQADLDWVRPWAITQAGNERNQSISYLKWDKDLSDQTNLFTKAYYHTWDSDWTFIGQDNSGQAQAFSVDEQWYFSELGLTTMVDHRWEDGTQVLGGIDFKTFEGFNKIGNPNPPMPEEDLFAPFMIYRPHLDFLPETKLAFGGRYTSVSQSEDQFSWNASARHPLGSLAEKLPYTQSLDLRLLAGQGFALPTLLETTDSISPSDANKVGNPDLESIESTSYEIGLEGRGIIGSRPFTWGLNFFQRDKDQGILTVPTDASGDTVTFINPDSEEETNGFEAKTVFRPLEKWRVQLSASYFDIEDTASMNTDVTDQASNTPEWLGKSIIRYDNTDEGWGLQFTGNYVGDMYDIGSRLDRGINEAGLNPKFGDYFVADLSGYVHFDEQRKHKLSLAIENLFDKDHINQLEEGTRVDGSSFRAERLGPPRNVSVNYTVNF